MSHFVLLVNPWIYDFAAYDMWVRPLGLLTIASVLRSCGLQVGFIDCLDRTAEGPAESGPLPARYRARSAAYGCGHFRSEPAPKPPVLAPVMRQWKRYGVPARFFESRLDAVARPDAVLVGCTMTYWYPGAFEVIARVKRRWPEVPVALGGIYPTLCPEHASAHSGADIVVTGSRLHDVLRAISQVVGFDVQATATFCEERPTCPDYGLINHFGAAALLTGRGCPYRCSYCASYLMEPRLLRYEPTEVAAVVQTLCRRDGIRDIAFYDDALLFQAERHLFPILADLSSRGVSVRFHTPNGVHPRFVTPDVARALRSGGFVTLRLSFESANPERQQDSSGKVTTDELGSALEALRDAGFTRREVRVYALMGLPGQSESEVADTLYVIHKLKARSSLAQYSPIPGTADFEQWDHPNRELARQEPLLHNNTAFPYVAGPDCLGPDAYRPLQVLSRNLNEEIEASC
jgi:tRNA A37 methylthiotransferase MiaB